MKCKDCDKEGCSQRAYTDDAECVFQQWTTTQEFDWQSFRAEAAKDILCATLSGGIASGMIGIIPEKETIVKACIEIANELIKQLKEKEKEEK